ncbi:MAG: hypothetical protein K6G10_06830 [Butyrivibrio sp.]|nr:hypothetical protein [Butyrivibrio sp.]
MDTIREDVFYNTIEKMESVKDHVLGGGQFPTINELEEHDVKGNIEFFLPLVAYYASDPFKRMKIDATNYTEYKATVKYCQDILSKIELTDN